MSVHAELVNWDVAKENCERTINATLVVVKDDKDKADLLALMSNR